MKKRIILSLVILGLSAPLAEAMIVFDPVNLIQTSLTASNTAMQLVNESQQIQIALSEIKNYDGGVGQWANIQSLLQQLGNETQKGQALSYNMQNLDSEFQSKYPGYSPPQNYPQAYSNWSQTTLDTLRGTLDSSGAQAGQFGSEQASLNQLSNMSQTAQGRMQALQVGNMLATQQVSQMQKLRQLVIAQTNAQNAYASYQVQKDSATESASASWISAGDTNFPQYGKGRGFGSGSESISVKR